VGILKAPAPGPLTACLVLAALVAAFAALPASPLTAVLVAIFIGLLAVELDRSGRHAALRVVSLAAYLLPARIRDDMEAEWRDHVLSAGEAGMRPVLAAISIVRAAAAFGFRYRVRVRIAMHVMAVGAAIVDEESRLLAKRISAAHAKGHVATETGRLSWRSRWIIVVVVLAPVLLTAPLFALRPRAATKWPAWRRVAAGTLLLVACYVVVTTLLGAVMSPGIFRGLVLGLIPWMALWPVTAVIEDPTRVFAIGARIGGKPVVDAIEGAGISLERKL
jgi:hypothetical protein